MNGKTIDLKEYNDEVVSKDIESTLRIVYNSLKEKGYQPYDQIVGYLLSGDPSYIPRYNNSRNMLKEKNRDAIIEHLLRNLLEDE